MIEWAVADRPVAGEERSGDRAVFSANEERALAAAIDGLGHGSDAADAADAAARVLEEVPEEDPVALAQRCHEALRGTRGAAISLASIEREPPTLTWLGIGNVEGRLVRRAATESLLLPGGAAGQELPSLKPATLPLERGDLIVFATDGVDPNFADSLEPSGTCAEIAERLLERHARARDDALVLVARYLGDGS